MRIDYLEIRGFRSFGTNVQRIEFPSDLAVIHADNSQGKTSLAEAFEFLFAGTISRRQLGGGSPAEFQDSLRNAHLGEGEEVYVEIGIADDDGPHILRRTLETDFRGASDCVSDLTLDGAAVDGVVDAGLLLSDPPLQAPVLLEHSLRYAVSAKPGERSDYFRAVVEVADLDVVRGEIAALVAERESGPRSPLTTVADSLIATGAFGVTLTLDRARSVSDVVTTLTSTLNALVPPSPEEMPGPDALATSAARVSAALVNRRSQVIPVDQIQVPSGVQPPPLLGVGARPSGAADYDRLLATVERTVAETIPIFVAALGVDSVASVTPDHPVDCPLCATPFALTAERITFVRTQVADRAGLTRATEALTADLNGRLAEVAQLARVSSTLMLPSGAWAEDVLEANVSAYAAVGADGALLREAAARASALSTLTREVEAAVEPLRERLLAARQAVAGHFPLGEDFESEIEAAQGAVNAALDAQREAFDLAVSASEAAVTAVIGTLAEQTNTEGWDALLELAQDPQALWDEYAAERARDASTARLKVAQRKIDAAIRALLDTKLRVMAGSVRRWWSLMRPEELTAFEDISRRGAGNRYLDLTATLVPDEVGAGVSRNALAVLSNSQLNALGLATFLARCELLGSPVILLDDPVPGSDREHRYTFAGNVLEALLDSGRQIIVTTHDADLAQSVQTLHQHRGIDEYGAVLVDPRQGTRVTRTGDDFEHLMLSAKSQFGSPLEDNRRSAGNSLRIAAERLAKHILVDARTTDGDITAALEDYDGKNLAFLRPLVVEHVVKPNEPGLWQVLARILNDADHDAPPPQPADLKLAHDTLRDIKKSHGVSTASSATA